MARVSVLGLGNMGSALARAFLARGHDVTVWNRTALRAESLRREGAVVAATAVDAVRSAPLVVVCMMRYADIEEHLGGGPAYEALAGRTLVNLMLGTVAEAQALDAWASAAGAAYLDGAIPVFPGDVGLPGTAVTFAGDASAWEVHASTLAALGGRTAFLSGGVAVPNVLENALSVWFYHVAHLALLEAAGTARALGAGQDAIEERTTEVLQVLSDTVEAVWADVRAERWVDAQATIDVHREALETALADARYAGTRAGTLESGIELLEAAGAAGLAQGNLASAASWLATGRNAASPSDGPTG